MAFLKRAWKFITVGDTALSVVERAVWVISLSTVSGITSAIIAWIFANPYAALVIGLATWVLVAILLLLIMAKRAEPRVPLVAEMEPGTTAPKPTSTDTDTHQAQEAAIELGDTSRLFLTDGARFVPDGDSERRTIFLPALLEHWVGPFSSAVEAGRTFVAHRTEFDNCDIYGPGVFVLAEGSVEDTFHKCDWEEEWRAFWPATKHGRYVGVIALENCIFRRCNFAGVAVVVKPDEYKRVYRRFTGADPTE